MPKTITERQADRFWAIALDTGFQRIGVERLLDREGYATAETIPRSDYDRMTALAEKTDLAWKMNRDPNTRDLFE